MVLARLGNYKVFLLSGSALAFALGLFTPFWIIFIQDFGGGIGQFGFAIGLMALAQSVTSYFAGKYSDKLGRRIFLLIQGFVLAGVIIGYTFITTLMQLYILQVLMGMTSAIYSTVGASFLGDLTKKTSRGTDIGKFHAIVGILSAIAIMFGGYVAGGLGIEIIFYITAAIILVSTLILFWLKE